MTDEPITDRDEIIERLRVTETGDELTIEDESGYRDTQKVTRIDGMFDTEDQLLAFGDVLNDGIGRLVNIDQAETCRWTMDPERPTTAAEKITKLWVQ